MSKPEYHGDLTTASGLHRAVWSLCRELYPQYTLLENHPLKVNVGGRTTTLYIDIVIKELGVAIECHGSQHFHAVNHFHGGRTGFGKSVQRDSAKVAAIAEAGLNYLMVPFTEEKTLTAKKLSKRILKAIGA